MKKLFYFVLIFASSLAFAQGACPSPYTGSNCYFFSTSGSDSNNGTSEATPQAHLPGMATYTGSITPAAGNIFILRGCDDWGNSNFPLNWQWSGTSGSHITIGVDQSTPWVGTCSTPPAWIASHTYYTNNVIEPTSGNSGGYTFSPSIPTHLPCTSGGTQPVAWPQTQGAAISDGTCVWYNAGLQVWNRPKFDAGGTVMGGVECTGTNTFLTSGSSASFVDFNWIELVNYFNNNGSCFDKERWIGWGGGSDSITVNNFYIHASVAGSSSVDIDNMISAALTGTCPNCLINYAVIDNSDGTQFTNGGIQFPVQHSICSYLSNCIKPVTGGEYAYNDISRLGQGIAGVHANCIETIAALSSQPYYFHDNRIHDNVACESLQIGNPNEFDYVWNNLFYNDLGVNGPDIPQSCSVGVKGLWYVNNVNVDGRPYCASYNTCSGSNWTQFFIMQNNMCITNGTPGGSAQSGGMIFGGGNNITGATTITFSNNLVESLTTATSQGYTNSQTPYVYFPPTATSPTVAQGVNLTSAWPGGFSTNDTNYACLEQTVNGVVQSVCPQRTSNPRPPGTTAWDIGIYEFSNPSPAPCAACFAHLTLP